MNDQDTKDTPMGNFTVTLHGQSDVGLSRDHNEDDFICESDMNLAILADGMGGHNAGEVASQIAVQQVCNALKAVLRPEFELSSDIQYKDIVRDAVELANTEIHEHSLEHPECAGMGTTLVSSLVRDDNIILANVGDSRIYRLRDEALEQLTNDHSLVQELVDNGYLSAEEASLSVSKNLITRALGIGAEVEVDVFVHDIQDGDLYLLCSDGLSDLVEDEFIESTLKESPDDLVATAKALISCANTNGGTDNITVILVSITVASE
ncbi:MAG: Stp1/IreP family PP2C-type Ser/Thr phosphatase [Gammaproteobacteria bacterium]